MSRVTLLTDFGTRDGYVAAMKGVMADLAPGVVMDDASHEISRGDVRSASWALGRYWRLYPSGTVHLVVVDPGVGTDRLPLALEADGRFVVAPDNGVVSRVVEEVRSWSAVVPAPAPPPGVPASSTFHGRDVFAPAAARLAGGVALEGLGEPLEELVLLESPDPVRADGAVRGEVAYVDRFGNLVTNVPGEWVSPGSDAVWIADRSVGFVPSYGHGEAGALVAVIDSDGLVEVAVRDGSAAERLEAGVGTAVSVSAAHREG